MSRTRGGIRSMLVVVFLALAFRADAERVPDAVPTSTVKPSASTGLVRGAAPSFDCATASSRVEQTICADVRLAALDRELAAARAKAGESAGPEREWIAARDGCIRERDVTRCLDDHYRHRLVEVQIGGGLVEAPAPVAYVCRDDAATRLTAAFYDQTDPKSVVLTLRGRREIAMIAPAGSGTRYANDDVELRERHGEAMLTWSGTTYVCDPQ